MPARGYMKSFQNLDKARREKKIREEKQIKEASAAVKKSKEEKK